MARHRLWLALTLVAALLAPGTRAGTEEASLAPEAGQPAYVPGEPPAIWSEILNLRDEILFYTEEEDMEKVAAAAAELKPLGRRLELSIMVRMDLATVKKREDPARRKEVHRFISMQRAIRFIGAISLRLQRAAATGVPENVRKLYPDLERNLALVQHWVPDEYLLGVPPPSDS
jgi:hypothetical protein